MQKKSSSFVASCLLAAACSEGSAPSPATDTFLLQPPAMVDDVPVHGDLPCDVTSVLVEHCQSCHGTSPKFGAPMPLVSYADLVAPSKQAPGSKVYERVIARLKAGSMPPPPNAPPTSAELTTLSSWVDKGAKPAAEGQVCSTMPASAPKVQPKKLSCTPDTKLAPAHPWAVDPAKADDYVCYGVDITPDKKRHVIGLGPRVDNDRVVHHILLFRSDEAVSAEPARCSGTPPLSWQLYAQWAPGGDAVELPKEAGFPEEGTTHWVLQIHYNNVQALAGQHDATGYDLCTTDELRPNDAGVMASGDVNFKIPPRSTDYETTCLYPWGAGAFGDYKTPHPDVHVFSVMPHMHKLGRKLDVYKLDRGFTHREVVVESDNFTFGSQSTYPVDVSFTASSMVQTRCGWANGGDAMVPFGETTGDEMCFAFMAYYPVVKDDFWNWVVPSASDATLCYEGK
jgi:hypothetical protein